MLFLSLTMMALAAGALAEYEGNLNYRSPSTEHPSLGIDLPKVVRRSSAKREDSTWDVNSMNFTHGVASVGRCSINILCVAN